MTAPPLPPSSALLTDLYQLTMLQTYVEQGMDEPAVFEFFVRKLPAQRGFLLAAGLEQVLEYLTTLRFSDWELDWLKTSGTVSASFVDYLAQFRFAGTSRRCRKVPCSSRTSLSCA